MPCKGTGVVGCAVQTVVCSRSLCEWEVAGKEALFAVLLGALLSRGWGVGSHFLVVCPEVPRKGVPLGPWGCRDSGLPGDSCPVSV